MSSQASISTNFHDYYSCILQLAQIVTPFILRRTSKTNLKYLPFKSKHTHPISNKLKRLHFQFNFITPFPYFRLLYTSFSLSPPFLLTTKTHHKKTSVTAYWLRQLNTPYSANLAICNYSSISKCVTVFKDHLRRKLEMYSKQANASLERTQRKWARGSEDSRERKKWGTRWVSVCLCEGASELGFCVPVCGYGCVHARGLICVKSRACITVHEGLMENHGY